MKSCTQIDYDSLVYSLGWLTWNSKSDQVFRLLQLPKGRAGVAYWMGLAGCSGGGGGGGIDFPLDGQQPKIIRPNLEQMAQRFHPPAEHLVCLFRFLVLAKLIDMGEWWRRFASAARQLSLAGR